MKLKNLLIGLCCLALLAGSNTYGGAKKTKGAPKKSAPKKNMKKKKVPSKAVDKNEKAVLLIQLPGDECKKIIVPLIPATRGKLYSVEWEDQIVERVRMFNPGPDVWKHAQQHIPKEVLLSECLVAIKYGKVTSLIRPPSDSTKL